MEIALQQYLKHIKEITTSMLKVAESSDLQVIFDYIAEIAKDLVGAKYAALGIPDGKGTLKYFKTAGMTEEQIAMLEHYPKGHGLLGAIISERHNIRLDDLAKDHRSVGFPANHPPMEKFLGVPIQIGAQLFGMLYLCDRVDGNPFDESDELLIESLGSFAALVLVSAEVTTQHNRIHMLEERERIGMELHDGIIQSLYGIGMQVELLRLANQATPSELSPIVDSLNNVIEDIRRYILQLRQGNGNVSSVQEQLEWIVARLNVPEKLKVTIDASHKKPPFDNLVFESLSLIVSEAISNAVRHSQASRIEVFAHTVEKEFLIRIIDNGDGFDMNHLSEHPQGGLGLKNMAQRARLYGGELSIYSQIGKGTTLTVRVPIKYKI
jgi:signal transduction histidine kinase